MVDVGSKEPTRRSALARARVEFPEGVLERLLAGEAPKGPILEVARAAGVLAAKRTAELIPYCHPLGLELVEVSFEVLASQPRGVLEIRTRASCEGRTGVEMEALTAASVAALTVYDMAKALTKGISIAEIVLLEKSGGRSGTWRRDA